MRAIGLGLLVLTWFLCPVPRAFGGDEAVLGMANESPPSQPNQRFAQHGPILRSVVAQERLVQPPPCFALDHGDGLTRRAVEA